MIGRIIGQALLCVSLFSVAFLQITSAAHAAEAAAKKWQPWYDIGGFYNSDDASRGEVTLFLPITQGHSSLTFFEARGKFYEEDAQEGNFAIGYRQMLSNGFNFGAWIGVDGRSTEIDNSFWQLSGGLEMLSHNFDARLNFYGPVTSPQAAGQLGFTQVILQGNNIFMRGGEEVALYGIDGEIGARLPLEVMNLNPEKYELRVYGGAFYFDHEDAYEEIAGGKARLELRINDIISSMPGSRLTAEYEFSYDDVRDDRHEVGLRLRLPFSRDAATGREVQYAALNAQERRMLDGIERDNDIITTISEDEKVEDAITNVDFDKVAYVNNGGSITTTSANEGDNRLIIVNGNIIDGTQVIQASQTIMGGGSVIQVRGVKSGVVANFAAPGSMPLVRNNGAGDVLSLVGNNIHIDGLRIRGTNAGDDGVNVGSGKDNIAITQNRIINVGDDGIDFNNENSNILIASNFIRNADDEGIDFENGNSNVIIRGNEIRNAAEGGIDANNNNQNWTITGNRITGHDEEGIEFNDGNSGIVITNNTVNGQEEAVKFDDQNSDIVIAGNDLRSQGDEAIEFDNRNQNILIENNRLRAPGDDIIELGNRNSAIIRGNMLLRSGNAFEGIEFGANNIVEIIGNRFGRIGDRAIEFDSVNTVTIANNIFDGPIGNFLLDVNGVGSSITGEGNIANVAVTCQSGMFTGSVTFANTGAVLQNGVMPCN